MKKQFLTLCLVVHDEQVLLGYKKRGFGAGLWNGFGGKVSDGEDIEIAALRELQEEAGITVKKLIHTGTLHLYYDEKPQEELIVYVYRGAEVVGELIESEEMRPQWFKIGEIPYRTMWPDDTFWLPKFLKGEKFTGTFYFDESREIKSHKLVIS